MFLAGNQDQVAFHSQIAGLQFELDQQFSDCENIGNFPGFTVNLNLHLCGSLEELSISRCKPEIAGNQIFLKECLQKASLEVILPVVKEWPGSTRRYFPQRTVSLLNRSYQSRVPPLPSRFHRFFTSL
jgi:hypothetical protein